LFLHRLCPYAIVEEKPRKPANKAALVSPPGKLSSSGKRKALLHKETITHEEQNGQKRISDREKISRLNAERLLKL